MRHGSTWLIGLAVVGTAGCSDGGSGPSGGDEGARLATQFERLADSVDGAGWSPTAEALRHAAEIVRLTGHATPVTLTVDGASRGFLAVAEQLDFPQIQCAWPSDTGTVTPSDSTLTDPGGGGFSPPGSADPGPPPEPGECTQVGIYSMRTLIAWEPEHMAEVVRIVADPGSGEVSEGVPDVMTGLPTDTVPQDGSATPPPEPVPGDSAGGGGGSGGGAGYPGFMGEYLVGEQGTWYAVEGSQTNALESSGGACTADRATFDWAEFDCESARFGYQFSMRVAPLRVIPVAEGMTDPTTGASPDTPPAGPEDEHTIAMARTAVDGVRLTVVAWVPPPAPEPRPLPPDSAVTGATREGR
ncbi:MAG TPA: hypothetical protein VFT84_04550 [Gemmatimonadales bacterium]|nr:hypothetical protein [Gemmatimonadales bacterium]